MRIILVTLSELLEGTLSVLNPSLNFCAVVVDEVEPAKKILAKFNLPEKILFPIYELKEVVTEKFYECVVCSTDWRIFGTLREQVHAAGVSRKKFIQLCVINTMYNFLVDRALRYFEEHAAEFEMFATGISYTAMALDANQFKHKLFNFGRSSEDLYYNYQIARRIVSTWGGAFEICSNRTRALYFSI